MAVLNSGPSSFEVWDFDEEVIVDKFDIRSVTISGSFKAYGMRDGLSSGTDISITFDVPDGMPMVEVKKEIVRQKFMVDSMCLKAEMGKGMIPSELFNDLHQRAKASSQAIINEYESSKQG